MNEGEVMTLRRWANYIYMMTHSLLEGLCPECNAKFHEQIGRLITIDQAMYKACRRSSLVWRDG